MKYTTYKLQPAHPEIGPPVLKNLEKSLQINFYDCGFSTLSTLHYNHAIPMIII